MIVFVLLVEGESVVRSCLTGNPVSIGVAIKSHQCVKLGLQIFLKFGILGCPIWTFTFIEELDLLQEVVNVVVLRRTFGKLLLNPGQIIEDVFMDSKLFFAPVVFGFILTFWYARLRGRHRY